MECSICNNDLCNTNFKGINFKFCKNCNTVYIKTNELKKALSYFDRIDIIDFLEKTDAILIKEKNYNCSICGQKMEKISFEDVILDRCKQCSIVAFEDGELSKFFSKFSNEFEICSNIQFINKYFEQSENVNTDSIKEVKDMQNYSSNNNQQIPVKEKAAPHTDGFTAAFILLVIIFTAIIICIALPLLNVITVPFFVVLTIFIFKGFLTLKPQEAIVYTIFGKYYGSIKEPGFYWVNPLANKVGITQSAGILSNTISLKVRTLDSGAQKINDELGNPIQVGIIVTWQVIDTAKALFGVDNYSNFLASQSDTALRSIIRLYPYDAPSDSDVHSLRGDSEEISEKLKVEIQNNVAFAGIKILKAKISHLAYAPEIAAAMLQRQQANAVLDAKKAIVDGSVDMVTMALDKLASSNVQLDEKTKANMVNNLLVALCSNKDNQPVTRLDVI